MNLPGSSGKCALPRVMNSRTLRGAELGAFNMNTGKQMNEWFRYAIGAAMMAVAGIVFFKEPASWPRLPGIVLSLAGLFLLKK